MTIKRYDITLNNKGYLLAPGRNAETASFATPFAPKSVEGDYSLSDFTAYSITAQGDFRGGMGQLTMGDTAEYLWGHRIDGRGERVTLGPKLDTTQPTAYEGTGSLGVLDINGTPLTVGIGNEPEDNTLEWFTLDAATTAAGVSFVVPGGSSFSPADLSGLALWLRSDTDVYQDAAGTTPVALNNDPVGLWKDLSGNANDFSQSTAGSRPTYKTAVQNSLPGIAGDAVADHLAGSVPVSGTSNRTIFVVLKAGETTSTNYWADFGKSLASAGQGYGLTGELGVRVYSGSRTFSALSTSAYQIVAIRQDGSNTNILEAWLDGVSLSVSATSAVAINTATDSGAMLFARNSSGSAVELSASTICEIIVYDSALSASDRESVEAYLAGRYAISVTSAGDYDVQRLWAYVRATNNTRSSMLYLRIRANASGSPDMTGTVLSATVNLSLGLPYYGAWISATAAAPATLTAGSTYWLTIEFSSSGGESVDILTPYSALLSTYKSYDGVSWSNSSAGHSAALTAQYLNLHPDTPVVRYAEYNNRLYALSGRRLYEVTSATTLKKVTATFTADAEDMLVVQLGSESSGKLLVCFGKTGGVMQYWDGASWTSVTSQYAVRLAGHDRLFWRANDDTTDGVYVQGTTNYTNWNDGASPAIAGDRIPVGDRRYPVEALFSWRGTLYAGKKDGLYAITYDDTYPASTATGQANRVIDLSSEIHENNFKAWTIFRGDLYFSLAHGLAQYTSSNVLTTAAPDASLLTQAQKRGKYTALVGTLGQMYAIYESSVEDWSQILAFTGTGWHSLATLDRCGDIARTLYVDSSLFSDIPRVWTTSHCVITSFTQPTWSLRRWTFATDSPASVVKFFDHSSATWSEKEGRLYTSWIDADLKNITKDWIDLDVVASNLDAEFYIKVYYRSDENDAFTLLGTVNTMPVATLSFPSSTTGRKLQLRFDLYTNESYNSPVLEGYALRYVPRPEPKLYFTVQVLLADNLQLLNGAPETRSVRQQWVDLEDARKADETVTFISSAGISYTVHVDQITFQRAGTMYFNEDRYANAYVAVIGMREA